MRSAVYKDKREAVEHIKWKEAHLVSVSYVEWKKLKVICFVKQNEIAWFSVLITTLVVVLSVHCYVVYIIHEEV